MKKFIAALILAVPFIAQAAYSPITLKLIFKNDTQQGKPMFFEKNSNDILYGCLNISEENQSFVLNAGDQKEVQFTFLNTLNPDLGGGVCADEYLDSFGYSIFTAGGVQTDLGYNVMREEDVVDPNKTQYSVIMANETLPNASAGSVKVDSVECASVGGTVSGDTNCIYPNSTFKATNSQEISTTINLST